MLVYYGKYQLANNGIFIQKLLHKHIQGLSLCLTVVKVYVDHILRVFKSNRIKNRGHIILFSPAIFGIAFN